MGGKHARDNVGRQSKGGAMERRADGTEPARVHDAYGVAGGTADRVEGDLVSDGGEMGGDPRPDVKGDPERGDESTGRR